MRFVTARSHARTYMQSHRTRSNLESYFAGARAEALNIAFMKSSFSKQPGRVLKRVSKCLGSGWFDLRIASWTKHIKCVQVRTITYDADAEIELQGDYKRHSFRDDLIQLNEVFMLANQLDSTTRRGATVSVTLHTLTRILERHACTPEDLPKRAPEMMSLARHITMSGFTEAYPSATNSFLIPFAGGALVAINCPLKASGGAISVERFDGLSIRTWLSPDMIRGDMQDRLDAMQTFLDRTLHGTEIWSEQECLNMLERNARPYDVEAKMSEASAPPTQKPARTSEKISAAYLA